MAQDWTSFTLQIAVKSDMETVWRAWSTSQGMEAWFLEKCHYYDKQNLVVAPDVESESGGTYNFRWYLYDIEEQGKITEVVPFKLFQFTFAGDCLVDIMFETKQDHVVVVLRQHNIPTDEKSKFSIRIGCLEGWTFYLANLKSILEGGIDLRGKIAGLRGLNN